PFARLMSLFVSLWRLPGHTCLHPFIFMDNISILDQLMDAAAAGDDERAEALVARLTPDDEPALLALATASDPDRRWWAVRALAAHGSAAAPEVVAAALNDVEANIRAAAALALAQLHHRQPEATR